MGSDIINKYVWLVDLLNRYQRLSRQEIDRHWQNSPLSGGKKMPERTFYHFRRAVEDTFNVEIACTGAGEYYIKDVVSRSDKKFMNWMIDSVAVNSTFRESPDVKERVMVEEVPSARRFLGSVLEAIRNCNVIEFTYAGFNRSRAEKGIRFSPYFMRLYKQRWYMVGLKHDKKEIRTYALDRITELTITSDHFNMPVNLYPEQYFANLMGITYSKADPKIVKLKVNPTQAKYFRALPFHETQQEEVGDGYSIFTYLLKLNYELVHEILSLGSEVEVLAPRELQMMVMDEINKMTAYYTKEKKK